MRKKGVRGGATMNHSFSEPDLARLMLRGELGSPRRGQGRESPRRRRGSIIPWHK